jgi:hypothetical protein
MSNDYLLWIVQPVVLNTVLYIQSTARTRIHEVYLVLRNRKVRQVYDKYAVSVTPLPSAGHWNILHAPRHNIYFGPQLYSAGLAFRGACGRAGVRV